MIVSEVMRAVRLDINIQRTAQVFNKTVFSARVPLHGYSSLYTAVLAAQLHNTPYACRSSFDVC